MTIPITGIKGIGIKTAEALAEQGYKTVEELATARPEDLTGISGFGVVRATLVIEAAKSLTAPTQAPEPSKQTVPEPVEATPEPKTKKKKADKPKKKKSKKKAKSEKKKEDKPKKKKKDKSKKKKKK